MGTEALHPLRGPNAVVVFALALLLGGCADFSSAVKSLNTLHVSGCHRLQITGAAGFGGGISGSATGIIATGDATLAECAKLLSGN